MVKPVQNGTGASNNTRASQNQKADNVQSQPIATFVVGPSGLFQEGLARILSAGGFQVVGLASRVDELLQSSLRQDQPLLLLIDAGDDVETAIKEIELIKQQLPAARIAIVAGSDQIPDLVSLLRAGAHACLVRGATPDTILKSLELVMQGETLLPRGGLPGKN
jgi:two-component system nitrate/nitrite response regulator NarL